MEIKMFSAILLTICFNNAMVKAGLKFTTDFSSIDMLENVPIGFSIFQINAVSDDGSPVTYGVVGDVFNVDEILGDISLRRSADYDRGEKRLDVRCIARSSGQEAYADITVNVLDANDNFPRFVRTSYKTRIPEDTPIGTTIFHNLQVTDVDYVNAPTGINVTCDFSRVSALYQESCEIFEIQTSSGSTRSWNGQIILRKALDYEVRPTLQVGVRMFDGLNTNQQSFEIIIDNVNDSPPYFVRQVQATISELIPVGDIINYVVARDGDKVDPPRAIRYTLTCNPGEYFDLNYVSGDISVRKPLDREIGELVKGYVDLCITAHEVISDSPEVIGNDSLTTVDAVIRINVQDENDNAPKFDSSFYTVNIFENIPNESALPELIMTVNDPDTGTANLYKFVLLDHTDVFAVFPDKGSGQATASIKVKDTSKIDYEVGPRTYILKVHAVETNTTSPRTGSALVTVHVLDVNDNAPIFRPPNYFKEIFENDPGGTPVVTVKATDSDSNASVEIRFTLVGNGADKFKIDAISGVITVENCATPGEGDCIDYEQRKQYKLTVMARDNFGTGRQSTGGLTVDIKDVNDNAPTFFTNSYIRYINEGERVTIDPLIIQTRDLDTVGRPTTYNLEGSAAAYWEIDSVTGNITAKANIRYEDSIGGSFIFDAKAQNSFPPNSFPTTVRVQIFVIDRNNYPPVFSPKTFTEYMREDAKPFYQVITILAKDNDSPTSENGQVEYAIDVGSQGKFDIDRRNGTIFTTIDAKFDYDLQSKYTLTVLARDGGNPRFIGSATVYVIIIDTNNRLPFFVPTTQRFEVKENVRANLKVYEVTATDPDVGATLKYTFEGPKSAITPFGTEVDINNYDYTSLFRMDYDTGFIYTTTNSLNRDQASVITYQMIVEDIKIVGQRGTGTVIITILEHNDEAPYFEADIFNITIAEELPVGTFIMTLIAQDKDDVISNYQLDYNPNDFFTISTQTGVVSINNRIDFEKIQYTEFTVKAIDNGNPQLTGSTSVRVTITNINDNSPQFAKDTYSEEVKEQIGPSGVLMVVKATDIDAGDFGAVEYRLNPDENRFTINKATGGIRLAAGIELDREREAIISIQVTAYDSPVTHSPTNPVRREYTIPVYFVLIDVNDNKPKFTQQRYRATIIETTPLNSEVLTLLAGDLDSGKNAALAFFKTVNLLDPLDLFLIGRQSGKVYVDKNLLGRSGTYVFEVEVRDLDGENLYLFNTAIVEIEVLEATNSPPRWVLPPRANMSVDVLESQYLGMLVYDAHAEDKNNDNSGIIDYGFYDIGKFTNQTKEFHINRVTGVIRAEIVYDREQKSSYQLELVARDRGDPFLETTRFLMVNILDVNDNEPRFPMENGLVKPYEFYVNEGEVIDAFIGQVSATDLDLAQYSKVYYSILAGNENKIFRLNSTTGYILLNKLIDREELQQEMFTLYIHATNNVSDYTVIRDRKKRELDASIVEVRVAVIDANDQDPTFIYPPGTNEYYGCISVNSAYGQNVIRIQADDKDSDGPAGLTYSITGGNIDDMFNIDPKTGIISNQGFLSNNVRRNYKLTVEASDGRNRVSTQVLIFVTSPANEEKLIISQKSSEVRLMIPQLIRTLSEIKGIEYVCVTGIRDHVKSDGKISATETDVYVTAVTAGANAGDYNMLKTDNLHDTLVTAQHENEDGFNALYIGDLGESSPTLLSMDRTPVLVVVIVVILLLIMAFILLCIACYCIRDSKRKKIKKYHAERGQVAQVTEQPVVVGKSGNPIYDNQGFVHDSAPAPIPQAEIVDEDPAVFRSQPEVGDQYASVQKDHPSPTQSEPVSDLDEPVIVTTIDPDYQPESVLSGVDDEPRDEPSFHNIPPPITEEEIETVIMDDSAPPSPEHQRHHTTPPIQEEDENRMSF